MDTNLEKYNKLTVLEKGLKLQWSTKGIREHWRVRCDCGVEKILPKQRILNGNPKSCGCLQKELSKAVGAASALKLSGQKFGRLLLKTESHRSKQVVWWNAICDCGKECIVPGAQVKQGHVSSCGCLQAIMVKIALRLPQGVSGFNLLYNSYKKGAKQRGHKFELNKDEFAFFTKLPCHYCGSEPLQVSKHGARDKEGDEHGAYMYNGIDRKDSSLGYILGNCLPCCGFCNYAKRVRSYDDFIAWIKTSAEYLIKQGL